MSIIFSHQQLKMSTTKHKALVTFEKHDHALACRRKFHRYVRNSFLQPYLGFPDFFLFRIMFFTLLILYDIRCFCKLFFANFSNAQDVLFVTLTG